MGWASGFTAGSNVVNNALSGASQRRERQQLMDIRQREEDDVAFKELQQVHLSLSTNRETGERRSTQELAQDPAYLENIHRIANTAKGKRFLTGGRDALGMVPTENGEQTLAVMGDDGKPKPLTLHGTVEGQPGSEEDPVISMPADAWVEKIERLLPLLDAERNISEGVANALARRYLAGDETALNELSEATGVAAPTDVQNVGAGTPALGDSANNTNTQTTNTSTPALGQSSVDVTRNEQGRPVIGSRTYKSINEIPSKYVELASAVGAKHGIDPAMLLAFASRESDFDPKAINREGSGAKGIGQFMASTAKSLGIDPSDPEQSFEGMVALIKEAQSKGKEGADIFRYYFAGPNKKGWGPKTEAYGDETLALYETYRNDLSNRAPETGDAELGGGALGMESGEFTRDVQKRLGTSSNSEVADTTNANTEKKDFSLLRAIGETAGSFRGRPDGSASGYTPEQLGTGVMNPRGEGIANDRWTPLIEGYTGNEREDKAALDAAVAKETDTSTKEVTEQLDKPVTETNPDVAQTSLEAQAAAMSERGVTPAQVTAAQRRAAKEDTTRALNSALATAVAADLMTLPQALDLVQKTQQTGQTLEDQLKLQRLQYDTQHSYFRMLESELKITDLMSATNGTSLSSDEAGKVQRNLDNLYSAAVVKVIPPGVQGQMEKLAQAWPGEDKTAKEVFQYILGVAYKNPVLTRAMFPNLDVEGWINGTRNIEISKEESADLERLVVDHVSHWVDKGLNQGFRGNRTNLSVMDQMATPTNLVGGRVNVGGTRTDAFEFLLQAQESGLPDERINEIIRAGSKEESLRLLQGIADEL